MWNNAFPGIILYSKYNPGDSMLQITQQNNTVAKEINKFQKKCIATLLFCALLTVSALSGGCAADQRGVSETGADESFESFTHELFCTETASNTISLHYSLKEPESYGIEESPVTFGNFDADASQTRAALENVRQALRQFEQKDLNVQNQITYDVLDYYLKETEKTTDYILYEEPLSLVSGVQTQFPVVLSEYRFYDREDVDTYLALLETTGEYFDSLIAFEQKKSEAGLFMADYAADTVIEQCQAFLDMGDGNYLYSTFVDRIGVVEELTEKEKSDYIQDNALAVSDYIFPAYEKLISEMEKLKGTGQNEKGLCYLPEGKEYYELVARQSTGTERTVREMEDLARRQISDDLTAMEQVLGISGKDAEEAANQMGQSSAELILNHLEQGISQTFPEAPDTVLEVKYVPAEMEEHLSPAFYMIPAIDNVQENVIYINQAHMGDDLTLFTTLAHEGYPGHLYQTIYYNGTDPDPIRSTFNFGGYVEGWATYAEMGSYYLMPLSKEQSTLLQKNASIILGLYALADMGIHYDGWTQMDTAAFFSNYGITDAEAVEQIYELIIGSPGNYLKYYIGYVEFLELKKDWVEEKGDEFSQKEFHEAVLEVGPAPFEIVKDYMWEMGI